MHHLTVLAAALGLASASPVAAVQKRATCTANLKGVWSFGGGGGPYSAPAVGTNSYHMYVTGGRHSPYWKSVWTDTGPFDFPVWAVDYGAPHDLNVIATWDYATNHWDMCQMSPNGGPYVKGEVADSHDTDGPWANDCSNCTWEFDC